MTVFGVCALYGGNIMRDHPGLGESYWADGETQHISLQPGTRVMTMMYRNHFQRRLQSAPSSKHGA